MKKIKIIISVFILGFSLFPLAQEIKPIKVTIEKGIPGVSFSKTSLGIEFWVQEPDMVIAIDPIESKVIDFSSSTGVGLLKAHQKAVKARKLYVAEQAKKGRHMFSSRSESLIDFSRSVALRDTLGFKFVIDSWAIPPPKTSSLSCKFVISYFVLDTLTEPSFKVLNNVVLNKTKTLVLNGKEVALKQNGSSNSNGKKSLHFQINTLDIGALVEKVELVDQANKVLEDLTGYRTIEDISFRINGSYLNTFVNLRFTIKPLIKKTIQLEQEVSFGI